MATILHDAAYMALPMNIKRGNPIPLDTTAVWYNKTELETYAASGATSYVGQVLTLVADGKCEAYMISNEAGTLVKLASTAASGDLASDVATLQTQVNDLISKVGSAKSGETASTGLFALIDAITAEIGVKKSGEAAATGIYKYVDDKVAAATPEGYAGVKADVTKLVGTDKGEDGRANKTVREIAAEEVTKIVNGADASFDTLKEVADWISTHGTDAATMNTQIGENKAAIDKLNGDASTVGSVANTAGKLIDAALKVDGADKYALASDLTATNSNVSNASTKITALETKTAGLVDAEGRDLTVKQYVDAGDQAVQSNVSALKTRVDNLGSLAAKDEVSANDLSETLKATINGKADKGTTLTDYGITDAYTKTQTDSAIDSKITTFDQTLGTMAKANASEYTKTADLETALAGKYDAAGAASAVEAKLTTLENGKVKDNKDAIDILNGNASTPGSVDKKIADGISALNLSNTYADKASTEAHIANTSIHITSDERTKWNNASDIAANAAADIETIKGTGDGSISKAVSDAKTELIGGDGDSKTATTIHGAKKYADDAIATKIATLDFTDNAEANQFVTAVSETDGIVSVTRRALAEADIPKLPMSKITDLQSTLSSKQDTVAWVGGNYDATTNKGVTKSDLDAAIAGLTGVTHFRGTVESLSAVTTPANGDIVIVGSKEYIYNKPTADATGKWEELGDQSTHAIKGAIKNADIASDAAIAQSKIANLTTDLAARLKVEDAKTTYLSITNASTTYATKTELETHANTAEATYVKKNGTDRLMTADEGTKLEGIEAGAQVNVIEGITVGGEEVAPTGKKVALPIATATKLGLVKGSTGNNHVAVAADGTMTVAKVAASTVVADQWIEIDCGNASAPAVGTVVTA